MKQCLAAKPNVKLDTWRAIHNCGKCLSLVWSVNGVIYYDGVELEVCYLVFVTFAFKGGVDESLFLKFS